MEVKKMEWLTKLIEKHTKDGILNQDELIKEVNTEFPKYAVPKDKYNALSDTKKKLEGDISERDQQLENLKKVDAEGLQSEIDRLQGENKTAKETYESELKDIQLTNAIKLAVNGKVHDEDIVSQLIKKDEVIIGEDGKIVGLDEQINSLQKDKPFLFKADEGQQGFQKVGNEPQGTQQSVDNAIANAFGNTEK